MFLTETETVLLKDPGGNRTGMLLVQKPLNTRGGEERGITNTDQHTNGIFQFCHKLLPVVRRQHHQNDHVELGCSGQSHDGQLQGFRHESCQKIYLWGCLLTPHLRVQKCGDRRQQHAKSIQRDVVPQSLADEQLQLLKIKQDIGVV